MTSREPPATHSAPNERVTALMAILKWETKDEMSSFKYPDLHERQNSAAAAKKAMFEKFRAASQDPTAEERRKERIAIHEARLVRTAEREAAKKQRETERAAQATREAELAVQAQREAEEATARLAAEEAEQELAKLAEQKATRDARYAARKAAKKERRRGY